MFWSKRTDKLIDIGAKVTTGIMSGIDKAWYTDQEKSQEIIGLIKSHSDFVLKTLDESSIRSVTRRWVALGIMSCFSVGFLACFFGALLGLGDVTKAVEVAVAFQVPWLMLMVAGFFFGTHMIRGIKGGK